MKLKIVELENYKQRKVKEEKETAKKENKLLKKKKQKARKEEVNDIIQVPENNNSVGSQVHFKDVGSYPCVLYNHTTSSQDQLRSHGTDIHSEVLSNLSRILPNLNLDSTKMLEDTTASV